MAVLEQLTPEEEALFWILTDPTGVQQAEFLWRDDEISPDGCYRLWDFQWPWSHPESNYTVDMLARQTGKALDVNTIVPSPRGWVTMGSLRAGDFVYGSNNEPVEVLKAFDFLYERECFELRFSEVIDWDYVVRSEIVADIDHLWTIHVAGVQQTVTTGDIRDLLEAGRVVTIRGQARSTLDHLGYREIAVTAVRPVPSRPVRCITVDAEDHLFLAGESMVPTHNSVSVGWDAMAFIFNFTGQDMLITAPELSHLSPLAEKVEDIFNQYWLLGEMRLQNQNKGVKRQPHWEMSFANGNKIVSRLPQRDGKGVKGCIGEGTLVLTRRGNIPVEQVVEGDEVWTHRGRWREVLATYRYEDAPAVEVSTVDGRTIVMSLNHRMLGQRPNGSLDWFVPAEADHWVMVGPQGSVEMASVSRLADDVAVYDMAVEEDHSYVANGLYSHNQHPVKIVLDELQNYPRAGYTELIETLKTHIPGVTWKMHGVSMGVGRDLHYALTQGDLRNASKGPKFQVLFYTSMHKPTWSTEERDLKVSQYGGDENHPDYIRNVYGLPSEAGNSLFVTARLMSCVRMDDDEYNDDVYQFLQLSDVMIDRAGGVDALLNLPLNHLDYSSYWAGMDVGFTNDPSEILVWGSVKSGPDKGKDVLLTRVRMERVTAPDQMKVISYLFDFYGSKLKRFGMDSTGVGLPIYQLLQDKPWATRISGYNFSGKYPVEIDETSDAPELKDKLILQNIKDYGVDVLRKWVDEKKIVLPFDKGLLGEWQGATSYIVKTSPTDDGVTRRYGGGGLHTLDAGRMYAAAKSLMPLEEMLNSKPEREDVFIQMF